MKLNRSSYNRADAVRALGHHLRAMADHRRQAEDIIRHAGLRVSLRPQPIIHREPGCWVRRTWRALFGRRSSININCGDGQ